MQYKAEIEKIKAHYGEDLIILAHYYQRDEVFNLAGISGDSYKLAVEASRTKAKYIVFCGVLFMAESSRILAREEQKVYLPDFDAGCPLADMIDLNDFERAYNQLYSMWKDDLVPIVYVNSSASIKAAVGKRQGLTCTSSNAVPIIRSHIESGKKVFFIPDKNLGINTARLLKLSDDEVLIFSPKNRENQVSSHIKLVVWPGFCYVHNNFSIIDVRKAKIQYPYCKILVHPECPPDVVDAADFCGSTSQIINQVKKASVGEVLYIGTEFNLVNRLSQKLDNITVFPLKRSGCVNMSKITLQKLYFTLKKLIDFQNEHEVVVNRDIKKDAKKALRRMIEFVEKEKNK